MSEERQAAAAREWRVVHTDEEFASLFKNATVIEAVATLPKGIPLVSGVLHWHLSDGRWLAMDISADNGCDTCGYGGHEKIYWVLDTEGAEP